MIDRKMAERIEAGLTGVLAGSLGDCMKPVTVEDWKAIEALRELRKTLGLEPPPPWEKPTQRRS